MEVFAARTVLAPAHVGVLASLGIERVLVYPRPVVGVLSTGNELTTGPAPLRRGQIRDSNRPALLARLRADGFGTLDLGTGPDDEDALTAIIEDGAATCDAIVVSGGVSVGDRDLVKIVLWRLSGGAMRSMQLAVKPGRPFAFATLGTVPVFGLPGNPVAALVSYELLVRPAICDMAGLEHLDRPRLEAVAEADFPRRKDGKLHIVGVVARAGADAVVRAVPAGEQGSHRLSAMAAANALAIVPDGDGIRCGDVVDVLLLDPDGLYPLYRVDRW